MAATANTSQARNAASGKQMLAFQALSGHEDYDGDAIASDLASILSSDLLRGKKAVTISHNGSTYRLQATRLGKLILTK
jgi:hemin uptake protein HemP